MGELTALPRPTSWLRGSTSKGRAEEEEKKGKRKGEREITGGPPTYENSWIRPVILSSLVNIWQSYC